MRGIGWVFKYYPTMQNGEADHVDADTEAKNGNSSKPRSKSKHRDPEFLLKNKEKIITSLRERARLFSMMGYVSLILIGGLFILAGTIYLKSEGIATQTQVDNLKQLRQDDSLRLSARIEDMRQKLVRDSIRYSSQDYSGVISENSQLRSQVNTVTSNYRMMSDSVRILRDHVSDLKDAYFNLDKFSYDEIRNRSLINQRMKGLLYSGTVERSTLETRINELTFQLKTDSLQLERLRSNHQRVLFNY